MIRRGALALAPLLLAVSCGKPPSQTIGPSESQTAAPPVESADIAARPPLDPGSAPPLFWIGLDGLDSELLDRLSAAGRMPNWTRLVAEGYSAPLRAFHPLLSPILWTTAATGVDPSVHGVLDFQEVDAATGRKLPISGLSRRVPAIWNVASAAGKKVGVVGWWATHPAEEVNGFFVSDRVAPLLFVDSSVAGLVYPTGLAEGLEQVRRREGKVEDSELTAFVRAPLEEVRRLRGEGGANRPVDSLARIIGATRVTHRVARDLYDRERPELMAFYLPGTDEIGHVFAPYRPPKLSCVTESDAARYGEVVDAYYALVDRILGQWMRRAREDGGTILIHSDHGFEWGEERSCDLASRGWNTASFWHRPEGVFLAWGHRVRPARSRDAVSLFDVAPTVASLLGIAADRALPGKPVTKAFDAVSRPPRGALFGSLVVRRVAAEPASEAEAAEYAKKLIALGYISGTDTRAVAPTGEDRPGWTEGAWNNLGLYYRETAGDPKAARQAFEKAIALRPDYATPMFNLAVLHRRGGDSARAKEWLFRALAAGYPDPEGTLLRWAIEDLRQGRIARGLTILERGVEAYPTSEGLAQQLAFVRFQQKDCPGAAQALARFETRTRETETLNSMAMYRACLGRHRDAIALLERSLALRPDQPEVRDSLERLRRR